jgi:hypothetical protein
VAAHHERPETVRVRFPSGNTGTVSASQARRCHFQILSDSGVTSTPEPQPEPSPVPEQRPEPKAAEIRAWAKENSLAVPAKGRIPADLVEAYRNAH